VFVAVGSTGNITVRTGTHKRLPLVHMYMRLMPGNAHILQTNQHGLGELLRAAIAATNPLYVQTTS